MHGSLTTFSKIYRSSKCVFEGNTVLKQVFELIPFQIYLHSYYGNFQENAHIKIRYFKGKTFDKTAQKFAAHCQQNVDNIYSI